MSQVQVIRWQPINFPLLKSNTYEMKYLYHTITQYMSQMKGELTLLERIRIELKIATTLEMICMLIWSSFNPESFDQLPQPLLEVTDKNIFNSFIEIGKELDPHYISFMPLDLFLQLGVFTPMIRLLLPYSQYQEAWQEIQVFLAKLHRYSDVILSKVEYLMGLLKITPEEPFIPFW